MRDKPKGRPARHGAYSLIVKAGGAPEHRAYLRAFLAEAREGLLADLGPTPSMAQRIILDRAISKVAVLRIFEEHSAENGVFIDGQLSPVLGKNYLAYSNSLRLDLEALGLERKSAGTIDVLSYVKEFDEAKAKEKPEAAQEDAAADSPDVVKP